VSTIDKTSSSSGSQHPWRARRCIGVTKCHNMFCRQANSSALEIGTCVIIINTRAAACCVCEEHSLQLCKIMKVEPYILFTAVLTPPRNPPDHCAVASHPDGSTAIGAKATRSTAEVLQKSLDHKKPNCDLCRGTVLWYRTHTCCDQQEGSVRRFSEPTR